MNVRICELLLSLASVASWTAPAQPQQAEPMQAVATVTAQSGHRAPAGTQVALFWHAAAQALPADGAMPDRPLLAAVDVTAPVQLGRLGLTFTDLPPPEALQHDATGGTRYAVGVILAYEDTDADGRLDCAVDTFSPFIACTDRITGGTPQALVVYSEQDWPADAAPLFAHPRHDAEQRHVRTDPGIRPPAGWSLVHLDAVANDHRVQRFCVCRAMNCAQPYDAEHGWTCNERGEPLSSLQAAPQARTWRDDDVLELRLFTRAEDVMFESQLRVWDVSE